jgi:hypothetical protein
MRKSFCIALLLSTIGPVFGAFVDDGTQPIFVQHANGTKDVMCTKSSNLAPTDLWAPWIPVADDKVCSHYSVVSGQLVYTAPIITPSANPTGFLSDVLADTTVGVASHPYLLVLIQLQTDAARQVEWSRIKSLLGVVTLPSSQATTIENYAAARNMPLK